MVVRLTSHPLGEVIALMGPSGSGKTTLLNVLARRTVASNARVSGDILTDGHAASRAAFRSIASFVEQEDALIGSLTTRETIDIAAHLSRPRSVSPNTSARTS
jgi:ABC-type multidrug transport system ATPase subunit